MRKLGFIIIFISSSIISLAHSDSISVNHYTINLEITDFTNKIIDGNTVLNMESKVNNLEIICLDLLALEIDSIIIATQNNPVYTYNDTLIRIFPEQSFNQNDNFEITVYYHGSPVVDPSGWGGFYFSGENAYNLGVGFEDVPHNYGRVWFPCIDDFVDRATYQCNITVLENHAAVCGGELVNIIDEGNGKLTYQWSLTDNIPTYLASVAVGEYVQVLDTFDGINGQIPIQIFTTPSDSMNAVNSFQNLKNYLQVFEEKFGAYAWQRVGYVGVPFNSGAMEHATNIAMPNFCINGNLSYEDLFSHELAHSWFGNLVTCQTAGDMWLNEGWASYSESVFRDAFYGRKNMQDYRRSMHAEVIRYAHIEDGGFLPLYDMPIDRTYSTTVYDKGDEVAHTLRCYLGDELFFAGVTAYLNEFAFSDASSYDFRDFLSNHTSVDLTDFFNDWVFTGGFPHYSIDSVLTTPATNGFNVEVFVKQKLRGRDTYLNANVVPITFINQDYSDTTVYMYFSGEFASESFNIDFDPKYIFCDFYEQVADASVKDYRFIKNTNIHTLGRQYIRLRVSPFDENIDSVFMHVTHNWVAPDSFKVDKPGIVLANNRYWTIEGDFPETCGFKGEFTYSNLESSGVNGYLDNEFITNDLDSLLIMYRPNRASDWEIVEAENITIMKRFIVENLQPGEYALAIKDWNEYVSNKEIQTLQNENIIIYPNPFREGFYILINNLQAVYTQAVVKDLNGKTIDTFRVSDITDNYYTLSENLSKGIYFISFYNEQGVLLETKKLLFQN
jgi:hypothetical protein